MYVINIYISGITVLGLDPELRQATTAELKSAVVSLVSDLLKPADSSSSSSSDEKHTSSSSSSSSSSGSTNQTGVLILNASSATSSANDTGDSLSSAEGKKDVLNPIPPISAASPLSSPRKGPGGEDINSSPLKRSKFLKSNDEKLAREALAKAADDNIVKLCVCFCYVLTSKYICIYIYISVC